NREVLEDDAEREGENVVADVFSSQGGPGDRDGQPEDHELGDHVAQDASRAAVAHLDGHRDPPWPGPPTRRGWLVSAARPGCAGQAVMSVPGALACRRRPVPLLPGTRLPCSWTSVASPSGERLAPSASRTRARKGRSTAR